MRGNINGKIEQLSELLGPALLLPWPSGSKGTRRKWKHLQLTDMNENGYLAGLEKAGNIGVALGTVSDGLVTIDLDCDDCVSPLLDANPVLTNTLRTAAERGCNIWVRCGGEYPRSCNLTDPSGNKIGEWRADGCQTIISGTHPNGTLYRLIVDKPVITIDYNGIIWPTQSILPPHATESKRVRGVRRVKGEQGVEEKEVVCVCGCCQQIQTYFTTDLISQVAPKKCHENNASLFKLARIMKSYENTVSRPAIQQELEVAFDHWSLVARPFWRMELGRDDYYAEFLEAYSYARIGLDKNPIEVAFSRAKSAPWPGLPGFSDERIRILAATCREMQLVTGDKPFFVPTRKLGELLGVDYGRVARWLRALEGLKVIHLAPGEVRKRGGNRSPRYLYGAAACTTERLTVVKSLTEPDSGTLTEAA
jgi:hypothetical protein